MAGISSLGYFFSSSFPVQNLSFLFFITRRPACSLSWPHWFYFPTLTFLPVSSSLSFLSHPVHSFPHYRSCLNPLPFYLRNFFSSLFFTLSFEAFHFLPPSRAALIAPPFAATVPRHPTQDLDPPASHASPHPLLDPSLGSPPQIISCPTFHSPPFLSPLSLTPRISNTRPFASLFLPSPPTQSSPPSTNPFLPQQLSLRGIAPMMEIKDLLGMGLVVTGEGKGRGRAGGRCGEKRKRIANRRGKVEKKGKGSGEKK